MVVNLRETFVKVPSNSENEPRSIYTEGNLRLKIDWASSKLEGSLCHSVI